MLPPWRPRRPYLPPWKPLVPVIWNKWLDGIPSTDPSEDDLTVLSNASLAPARDPHHLPGDDAVNLVYTSLNQKQDPRFLRCPRSQGLSPDIKSLPFRVFNDIDETIFGGVLRWNVLLCWSSLAPGRSGKTTRWEEPSCPRIKIELSKALLDQGSRQVVLEALLHQMVHAYLLQFCSQKVLEAPGVDSNLAHGIRFSTICSIILGEVIGADQRDYPYPSKLGCPLIRGETFRRDLNPRHLPFPPPKPGSTTCDMRYSQQWGYNLSMVGKYSRAILNKSSVPPLDLLEDVLIDAVGTQRPISQYFYIFEKDSDVPTPYLRCNYKSPTDCVEIHLDKHAFPITRGNLSNSSLGEKLSKSCVLQIPTTDWKTLSRLLSFIRDGNYKPDIEARNVRVHGCYHGPGQALTQGPPRIISREDTNDDFLIFDVAAYRLAAAIGFSEMCTYVLSRMNSQTFTRDDPCKVLEVVYHGSSSLDKGDTPKQGDSSKSKSTGHGEKKASPPDEKLRTWVKKWLKVWGPDSTYINNLQTLQKHPKWKSKYAKLRERGTEMITDIDAVEAELAKYYADLRSVKAETPFRAAKQNFCPCNQCYRNTPLHYNHLPETPTHIYPMEVHGGLPHRDSSPHHYIHEPIRTRAANGHPPFFGGPLEYGGLGVPDFGRQVHDNFPHGHQCFNHLP